MASEENEPATKPTVHLISGQPTNEEMEELVADAGSQRH